MPLLTACPPPSAAHLQEVCHVVHLAVHNQPARLRHTTQQVRAGSATHIQVVSVGRGVLGTAHSRCLTGILPLASPPPHTLSWECFLHSSSVKVLPSAAGAAAAPAAGAGTVIVALVWLDVSEWGVADDGAQKCEGCKLLVVSRV